MYRAYKAGIGEADRCIIANILTVLMPVCNLWSKETISTLGNPYSFTLLKREVQLTSWGKVLGGAFSNSVLVNARQ
jgi:hypothetical protein